MKTESQSGFKFLCYVVDKFDLSFGKNVTGLSLSSQSLSGIELVWGIEMRIAQPKYIKKHKHYICGLSCKLTLKKSVGDKANHPLLILETSVSGIFETDGRYQPEVEEKIAKVQAPAILLPYLRGAITTFLATGGFVSMVFPLINIHELAENTLKDVSIEVVE